MESERLNSRINFMKVPLDILEEKNLEEKILELLQNDKSNQIVLLSFADYIKARNSREFRTLLNKASLVLPSSSLITGGIKFLYGRESSVYINYDLVLKILSILERNGKSIYIIGSNRKTIMTSEKNLKDSYPGLHLVGRSSSFYNKESEKDITLAIKKSSPSLLLAGSGLKGKNYWLYRNCDKFNPGLTLWSPDCFEIFSGKKKRPSKRVSKRFFSRLGRSILKPWRIFYIFPYLMFHINLIVYRLFKNK
ncbi:WecB/TagA/CpsF family glycosyltransferase [Spirochaeta isovalerica]|uniref:N-acetylglucosaminyldiphosphoundecaprenol N-acetyl-beta-D-mannosaminyltransferase n=1 Tax=Spirochaeta isovalerica TaxID=150 RepID=A0A841RGK6_9SPIO|nr:WecB/TagA/CpsF family glycosyltransferase [Spirochaeta isovalerica]MBB6482347.1 N-acetylglucosaminyldiphosphoundecaprenol N-acetyl-beta-D-mannosaminyltransferase [Spirochaeta isovalerica]